MPLGSISYKKIMITVTPTSYMFRNEKQYIDIVKTYVQCDIASIRVNWTRFTDEEYYWQIAQYRKAFRMMGIEPIVMVDIPAPGNKYRLFFELPGKYAVEKGGYYTLVCGNNVVLENKILNVKNVEFYNCIQIGDSCIVGDGEVEFEVVEKKGNYCILLKAINSGIFTLGKSITSHSTPYYKSNLEQDILRYEKIINDVHPDYLILSFCETRNQIEQFKKLSEDVAVVPKIETKRGVMNLENMLTVCETFFLGRGDLGVTNRYEFAELQNMVIEIMKQNGKELIIATDLLESIDRGTCIPIRAELTELYYMLKNGVHHFVTSSVIGRDNELIKRFCKYVNNIVY